MEIKISSASSSLYKALKSTHKHTHKTFYHLTEGGNFPADHGKYGNKKCN